MSDATTPRKPRGLAALTPERRREIAAAGGRAVPAHKRVFSYNREAAAACGRKGGQAGLGHPVEGEQ